MDRIDIFKELSLNDLKQYDSSLAKKFLGNYYAEFSDFCAFLRSNIGELRSSDGESYPLVKTISCDFTDDGVHFSMEMLNGKTQDVFISKKLEEEFKANYSLE